jgi:CRP-like cAMP-binding protein
MFLPMWGSMTDERCRNQLLCRLSDPDFDLIKNRLETVELSLRMPLEDRNRPIDKIYFPEAGMASVVATSGPHQVEAGVIGREGMTGISILLADDRSANSTFIQVAGTALCITADALRDAMQESESLRTLFLRFVQAFMTQMSQTALANGRAKLEERLARWLLMAHDRLDGRELPLTHEFLALMLGVRRAGVTTALQALEDRGLISIKRGLIVMEDREGMLKSAGALYGIPEAEYRRLISPRKKV